MNSKFDARMEPMLTPVRHLRILVAGWEGGGNVPPTITAVRALVSRGHDVRVIADDCLTDDVQSAGARFLPWRRAPNRPDRSSDSCFVRDWETPDPMAGFARWCEKIFIGPAASHAQDMLDALSAEPADIIVASDLLFGSMLAGEVSKTPTAVLSTNISPWPLPGHPPFGPGFQPATSEVEKARDAEVSAMVEQLWNSFLPALNRARMQFGLTPLGSVLDQPKACSRHLLATSAYFDYPTCCLPEDVRYVGPLLEEPGWVTGGWQPEKSDRPLVLVSFSTTNQGQQHLLQKVVDALGGEPVNVIVTLGKALEHLTLATPRNVTVVTSASHDAILPHVAAVVTHGGHGTTLRALRYGVPLAVIPLGRDQNDNAARVEYHGAGLRLDPMCEPTDIARGVRRLVGDAHFKEAARRLSTCLAAEPSPSCRLIAEIENMAIRPCLRMRYELPDRSRTATDLSFDV